MTNDMRSIPGRKSYLHIYHLFTFLNFQSTFILHAVAMVYDFAVITGTVRSAFSATAVDLVI